jgi:hypothetical protein
MYKNIRTMKKKILFFILLASFTGMSMAQEMINISSDGSAVSLRAGRRIARLEGASAGHSVSVRTTSMLKASVYACKYVIKRVLKYVQGRSLAFSRTKTGVFAILRVFLDVYGLKFWY